MLCIPSGIALTLAIAVVSSQSLAHGPTPHAAVACSHCRSACAGIDIEARCVVPVTFSIPIASLVRRARLRRRRPIVREQDRSAHLMFKIAILLFAVAAVIGLTMAVAHFRGHTPPKLAVALLHGLFAASGLVVLLLGVMQVGMSGKPAIALCLFLVAALGGF